MGKTLIIWFKDGGPSRFGQVENFYDCCEDSLEFTFFEPLTKVKMNARIHRTHIVGYALEED